MNKMPKDVKNWTHKKGEEHWAPFLDLLQKAPISDEEFEYIVDHSGDNFKRHRESHFNPARECLNKIHAEKGNTTSEHDLEEIDYDFLEGIGNFVYGKRNRINFRTFLDRLSKYPMSDNLFEDLIEHPNTTGDYVKDKQNIIDESRRILSIAKEIRNRDKNMNNKQDIFAWVDWFGELAKNISKLSRYEFSELVTSAIEEATSQPENRSIIRFEAYDPFSFFYYLAQKNTINQRRPFFQNIARVFNINSPLPNFDNDNCWVFPTPTSHTNVLYKWSNQYEPKLLWDFYQQIISIKNIDELSLEVINEEFIEDFKSILNLKGVGVPKLTQTLFLMNPNVFFTIDWILKPISASLLDSPNNDTEQNIRAITRRIEDEGFLAYIQVMQKIIKLHHLDKKPYEINYDLWLLNKTPDNPELKSQNEKKMTILPLNQILYGPPGTGKTYSTVEKALEILEPDLSENEREALNVKSIKQLQDKYGSQIEFVTFHQSFSYEDFVEGIKAEDNGERLTYKPKPGIFKTICANAEDNYTNANSKEKDLIVRHEFDVKLEKLKKYVLIIDEINRGNISRIFGELITLIEPSKRIGNDEPLEVQLPYSKEPFGVPSNLHIIGTMNTADRSLANIDIALRRRFRFEEMPPDYELEKINRTVDGIDLSELLKAINYRICQLLDREHQIGHSFFMRVTDFPNLKEVFQYEILPLLEEYFFDDWDKIKQVLNDTKTHAFYSQSDFGDYTISDADNTLFERGDISKLNKKYFIHIYHTEPKLADNQNDNQDNLNDN